MQPARSTLKKIFADVLRREGSEEAVLLAWPAACGPVVARNTSATLYAEGVLTVEVPDPTWQQQLHELHGQYLAALNELSPQPVSKIRFVAIYQPKDYRKKRR
jgi:predicted nucleic acid-binding Zn ribbon protein